MVVTNGQRLPSAPLAQNWDTYRYFLAVARMRSIASAARLLGESSPTVSRRIRELEAMLDVRLLERRSDGVALTAEGEQALASIERIEGEAVRIGEAVHGGNTRPHGDVTVTSPCGLGAFVLSPSMGDFNGAYPHIVIDLVLSARKLNLWDREADIAVRLGDPKQSALVGRRLGHVEFSLYAHPDYLARHGTPQRAEDLDEHLLIDSADLLANAPQARLLRSVAPRARRVFKTGNVVAQLGAARSGLGLLAVPRYVGETAGDLVPVLEDEVRCDVDCWLLTHPDLRSVARVRATLDFLGNTMERALAM